MCGYHIFIIGLSFDVNLGCIHILAIVNDTINTMEMAVQVSRSVLGFTSFRYILRHEIAALYGNSVLNIQRNLHTVFYIDCNILHSQ